MGLRWKILIGFSLALTFEAAADDGIVVDHSANRIYGWFSDTAIGPPRALQSQQTADNIVLDAAVTVRHVSWWGYYYFDVVPSMDSMRMRFYDSRALDGLPGNLLVEQNILNPPRAATGLNPQVPAIIPGGIEIVTEYQFAAVLPTPVFLDAQTPYWLEIVQFGGLDSIFGWRGATAEDERTAVAGPGQADRERRFGFDMAFQLSTIPEPGTLAFILLSLGLAGKTTRRDWFQN